MGKGPASACLSLLNGVRPLSDTSHMTKSLNYPIQESYVVDDVFGSPFVEQQLHHGHQIQGRLRSGQLVVAAAVRGCKARNRE